MKKEYKVVLVGGGHTHALVLAKLRKKPIKNATFTVIDPNSIVPYTGMLPGYVSGIYTKDQLEINIERLCKETDVTFVQDRVVHVDPGNNQITLSSRTVCSYDIISVDVGIHSKLDFILGFKDYAVPVKPLYEFTKRWQDFFKNTQEVNVVVIGGGVAGAEMALAIKAQLSTLEKVSSVTLLEKNEILKGVSSGSKKNVTAELKRSSVHVKEQVKVMRIEKDQVVLDSGEIVPAQFVLGAAGARPYLWLRDTQLSLTNGFIQVNKYLQTPLFENIFAVGDCAHFLERPLPKAGVFAVREAPFLYKNIDALVNDRQMTAYKPQKNYLKVITLGGKRGCADKWGLSICGHLAWRLRDHIDRTFIDQFK